MVWSHQSSHHERILWELLILFMLLYWIAYLPQSSNLLVESLDYGAYGRGIGLGGRPILYPSIVDGIVLLSGSFKSLQIIQFILFFTAFAYLLTQLYRWTKNFWISFLFLMLMILNYEAISYCFFIMTESFVMTLLMLILGLLCQWLRTQHHICLWAMSLCVGLAIMLKSSCYSWVVCLLILPCWIYQKTQKKQVIKLIAPLALPLIFCLLLSSSIAYFKNGIFGNESTLGEMLIGKAGVIVDANMVSSQPLAFKKMLELSEPVQALIKKTDTWRLEYLSSLLYYDTIRFAKSVVDLYKPYKADYIEQNKYRLIVAKEIIKQKPIGYLTQIGLNYLAMWLAWDLLTSDEYNEWVAFIKKNGPLPYYENLPTWNYLQLEQKTHKVPALNVFVYYYRIILGYVGLISLLLPICLVWRWLKKQKPNDYFFVIITAAWMTQCLFIVTAVVNNSALRYSIIMWPAVVLAFSLSFCWIKTRDATR